MIPVLSALFYANLRRNSKNWCSSGVVTIFCCFSAIIFQPCEAQSHVINNKAYICKYAISDNFFKRKSRESKQKTTNSKPRQIRFVPEVRGLQRLFRVLIPKILCLVIKILCFVIVVIGFQIVVVLSQFSLLLYVNLR